MIPHIEPATVNRLLEMLHRLLHIFQAGERHGCLQAAPGPGPAGDWTLNWALAMAIQGAIGYGNLRCHLTVMRLTWCAAGQ